MSDTPATIDHVASLGEVLSELAARLRPGTALGVILVDGTPLEEIEARFGHTAHAGSLQALACMVAGIAAQVCGGAELVATGEVGRPEVFVFQIRPVDDADFLRQQLPACAREISDRLGKQGQRVVYPYLRQLPELFLGSSYIMRNPRLGAVSQIRDTLIEARADAELNARIDTRARRGQFLDLLVSGSVHSVYEPIVDARELTVFGYEALARGAPGTSFTSAYELFGTAERENLLFELDCLCRRKALEGAIDFPEGAKLFMNIRPTSIHDPSFQPDVLTRTLDECGLSPSDVVFEISEQESIENYEIFREARDAYGKLGFQFALDDTGAGYASLEAVLELSPEFIKVDRAFVHGINEDPARQNMVRAFQRIAEDTNARIIGEGLDTLEELQTLGRLGIQFGQGWLFGKPAPLRAGGS